MSAADPEIYNQKMESDEFIRRYENNVDRMIFKINKCQKENADFEHTFDAVSDLLNGYLFNITKLIVSGIFRARQNQDDELWLDKNELWYPPAEFAKIGRFNLPNKPVLYACNLAVGALLEVRALTGHSYSIVKLKQEIPMKPMASFFIGREKTIDPIFGDMFDNAGEKNPYLNDLMSHTKFKRFWLKIDRFLSDISTHNPETENYFNEYLLSNCLYRFICGNGEHSCIVYPSRLDNYRFSNFCISAQTADDLFNIRGGWVVKLANANGIEEVYDYNNPNHSLVITHTMTGITYNREIEWTIRDSRDGNDAFFESQIFKHPKRKMAIY